MSTYIKAIIKRNYFLSWLLYQFMQLRAGVWEKECENRAGYPLTDYQGLAAPLPLGANHPIIDNNLYGLNDVLKSYGGLSEINHRIFFEHGLVFGGYVQKHIIDSFAQSVLTFSDYRENYLRKTSKAIIKIGPYIHYASPLLSEHQFREVKNEMGRVLLVFPSHSIKVLSAEFDIQEFIEHIQLMKRQYDNVIVSLYWKDIELGKAIPYVNAGFKVMTAGHINDRYFLPRLKSIISLADMTMSNEIGTHVGYCIYMKKPHYIYKQHTEKKSIHQEAHVESGQRSGKEMDQLQAAKDLLSSNFSKFEETITTEQLRIINEIWGLDHVKSSEEIKKALRR